jgi:PBP1b-binding outer membrane lipoprotein LpoB
MNTMNRLAVVLMTSIALAGCANWQRNTYESIRQQQSVQKPAGDKPATNQPDYDTYQKELKQLRPGSVQ